jgi:hypothetical protein
MYQKDGKNPTKNGGKELTKEEKLAKSLARMKCFNCGGKGHPAKACPHKEKEAEESPMAGMAYSRCFATKAGGRLHEYYEVCLVNGSQVNIIDPRLLANLRTSCRTYRSMNDAAETKYRTPIRVEQYKLLLILTSYLSLILV